MPDKPKPAIQRPTHLPVFSFVPFGIARDLVEVVAASVPGAAILFFFMFAVGVPTILTNSNWFAAPYIPVTCLLPLVVGMVSPLALEWLRASAPVSLKKGVLCSLLSGLAGSTLSVASIFIASMLAGSNNPFGPSIKGLPMQFVVSVAIIGLAAALSTVGGAVLMLFIKKAPAGE